MVRELAADGIPVAVTCRVLKVSTSGYYEWRDRPASLRQQADDALTATVREIHAASYGTYGARRVHAELRLGGARAGDLRLHRGVLQPAAPHSTLGYLTPAEFEQQHTRQQTETAA